MARIMAGRIIGSQDKAAAFMIALSEESKKLILNQFKDEEIRTLSHFMSRLGVVEGKSVELVFEEFIELMQQGRSVLGTSDSTRGMLEGILGKERADLILEGLSDETGSEVWEALSYVNESTLAAFLTKEKPQTAAIILSRIQPTHASKIFTLLPEDFAIEVMLRILNAMPLKQEVMREIENTLREDFIQDIGRRDGLEGDPHRLLADIFNNFDRQSEEKYMESLESKAPESAERIQSYMFTFDDLARVDNRAIQRIIGEVDGEVLVVALKGAKGNVKDIFLSNMSERARKLLQEEIDTSGAVRIREIDEAQTAIVKLAKQLDADGIIALPSNDPRDELVS